MEFIEYNANPKKKRTSDCVVRAICTALKESWEDTYKGLFEITLKKCYAIGYKNTYEAYLKQKGYEKHKMPRRLDNTRYTVKEFANELAKPNKTYIITIANHMTILINNNLYDTWNCSNKSVCNYWVVDDKLYTQKELQLLQESTPKKKHRVEL